MPHTRRAIVAGLASLPAIASTSVTASTPDPIFAAIDAHRAADARRMAFIADHTGDLPDSLADAEFDRFAELLATTPTTPAGCAAMLRYFGEVVIREDEELFSGWSHSISGPAATLFGRLAAVIEPAV